MGCLQESPKRWEVITSATLPPWVTAPSLVATGREILFVGGTKPQNIGDSGILRPDGRWKDWYADVGAEAYVFDTATAGWTPCDERLLQVSCGDDLRRSHMATCYVPSTDQIFVFGGSRYFLGEYFHDMLTVDLPGSPARTRPDPNARSLAYPGAVLYARRGDVGRLRGLVASGHLAAERLRAVLDWHFPAGRLDRGGGHGGSVHVRRERREKAES